MDERLAIFGGKPVRSEFLPYGKQWINDDDIASVVEVLKGDYLTTGPKVKEFEDKIAKYLGVKYAVAVSNGTAALHAACFAAGIKEGDEVITSPLTFAASANAVLYCGGTPIFADIDPKTMNIDPSEIRKKISSKTKAIIPVDYTGRSVDIDEIMKIAEEFNLMVIEDCAHGLGAIYNGEKVGIKAHMTEYSFHPVKHITSGEGGLIATNDDELYGRLIKFRTHGITRDLDILEDKTNGGWYYEQQDLGYNYRITDIQCALGISQLERLDEFLKIRRELAQVYSSELNDVEEIVLPEEDIDFKSISAWHLYVIRLNLDKLSCTRKEIYEALIKENIGVNVHYVPVYYHPYYKKLGYKKGLCPNAEKAYEEILSLPLFPLMDKTDVLDVVKGLNKVLSHYKKV